VGVAGDRMAVDLTVLAPCRVGLGMCGIADEHTAAKMPTACCERQRFKLLGQRRIKKNAYANVKSMASADGVKQTSIQRPTKVEVEK
jgi:hypothetical protein